MKDGKIRKDVMSSLLLGCDDFCERKQDTKGTKGAILSTTSLQASKHSLSLSSNTSPRHVGEQAELTLGGGTQLGDW